MEVRRERIEIAYRRMKECILCPRRCKAKRIEGEAGFCGSGKDIKVSSYGPHFGEEKPLVGLYGSGTIFFAGCNLGCVFCQNYDISHFRQGMVVDIERLVKIILYLEQRGCHNINFVTPTHLTPHVMECIYEARLKGLKIPVVYNCSGYEDVETLKLLEGFVDIYMPDFKYMNSKSAKRYSFAEDYPAKAKEAIKEMHRQVGDLVIKNDLAVKGLLVRHLVMPHMIEESFKILDFLKEISSNTYINIMAQYRPCYKAVNYEEINRRILMEEFWKVLEYAEGLGLRLDTK